MADDKQTKLLICQVFIDSINNYFEEQTTEKSDTGLPFIKEKDDNVIDDYTGMIGISGSRKGFVYFTGAKDLFNDIVCTILKINRPTEMQIMDMAGEVANTISGNVRKAFGSEFMISVPAIIHGKPLSFKMPDSVAVYIIPIKWRSHKAILAIGIE